MHGMGAASEFGHASATWDIADVARTPDGKTLLKRYLNEIVAGPAFKGSPRSVQFLEYVVWQCSAGRMADLKERTIGVELFGRSPAYDTGEDAIVRVTASDVRKRLIQHYSGAGIAAEFRISLPAGGYVPQLIRIPKVDAEEWAQPAPDPQDSVQILEQPSTPAAPPEYGRPSGWRYWLVPFLGAVALVSGIALSIINRPGSSGSAGKRIGNSKAAPWATVFDGSRRVLVIASDPNIEEIQRLSNSSLSLSDYANQSYLPPGASRLSPSQIALMKDILRGDKMSFFDGSIIASLATLMTPGRNRLLVKAARNIRVKDLQTEDDLIFLGSPRSNPWTAMFDPVLDFQFAFNPETQREFIRNLHPAKGESSEYIPTAGGFDTGDSFALISFFRNPGYGGRVLILAGASGEGTEAAGSIVTDSTRWAGALQSCHLGRDISQQSLQVLLHFQTVAGSSTTVSTVSCHILPAGV